MPYDGDPEQWNPKPRREKCPACDGDGTIKLFSFGCQMGNFVSWSGPCVWCEGTGFLESDD